MLLARTLLALFALVAPLRRRPAFGGYPVASEAALVSTRSFATQPSAIRRSSLSLAAVAGLRRPLTARQARRREPKVSERAKAPFARSSTHPRRIITCRRGPRT
jgi:hypothetical protein